VVNWSIVYAPKENGGLGIQDPKNINMALGEKLIWHLITGSREWWKKEIFYKYLSKNRKRCLETTTLNQKGSPIWNLIRAFMSLIQNHLRWSLGSGKEIKNWEDHFSDKGKLSCISTLDSLIHWLISKGKNTLFDISEWKRNGTWKKMELGRGPTFPAQRGPSIPLDCLWFFPISPL
jgi:hypothetical protein